MNGQATAQSEKSTAAPQYYENDAAEAGADSVQFITLAIGDDYYGIEIMAVREIKDWTPVRQLPHQPGYMRGICDLRGTYIPIVDLRCRFGQGLTKPTKLHVFIVVQIGDRQVGLLADRVSDIVSVARAEIKPVPEVAETRRLGFLSGLANVDGAMVGLLDLDRLMEGDANANAEIAPAPAMLDA